MPQLEPLESLGRKLPGVIEDTHRACHWVLGTRSEARGTRPSSFFDLLRPSSTFFVLLHPSSSFFNLLHLSSTFFILLRPSSSFFILLHPSYFPFSCYFSTFCATPTSLPEFVPFSYFLCYFQESRNELSWGDEGTLVRRRKNVHVCVTSMFFTGFHYCSLVIVALLCFFVSYCFYIFPTSSWDSSNKK